MFDWSECLPDIWWATAYRLEDYLGREQYRLSKFASRYMECFRRFGRPYLTTDPDDEIKHAWEEAADLCVYLTKAQAKGTNVGYEFELACRIFKELSRILNERGNERERDTQEESGTPEEGADQANEHLQEGPMPDRSAFCTRGARSNSGLVQGERSSDGRVPAEGGITIAEIATGERKVIVTIEVTE